MFRREPTLSMDTFLPAAPEKPSEYAQDAIARVNATRQVRVTELRCRRRHRTFATIVAVRMPITLLDH